MSKKILAVLAIAVIFAWLELAVFKFFPQNVFGMFEGISHLFLLPAVIFAGFLLVDFIRDFIRARIAKGLVAIYVEHNLLFARMKGGEQYRVNGNFSNDLSII
ncbi:hypothetical protein C9975_10330, partial [Thalassospira xiamenensis]